VETSIKLGILVTAPTWARDYAESRVAANADEKVRHQEIATQDVIEGYRDKPLPWLPSL